MFVSWLARPGLCYIIVWEERGEVFILYNEKSNEICHFRFSCRIIEKLIPFGMVHGGTTA
jgi:hypothetical protein